MPKFADFDTINVVDFEFGTGTGAHPVPVCLVWKELRSGKLTRLWFNEFRELPPYPTGPRDLFVAYYATAELSCHLALGWPIPTCVLDLCVEFKNRTSGIVVDGGKSLLGALNYFGLSAISVIEKDEMRELALAIGSGAAYSQDQKVALLNYCQSDVDALPRLLDKMILDINLPQALWRGRYMAAAAQIEWNGIPIDTDLLEKCRRHWNSLIDELIADIDASYGVFKGRTFKRDLFADYLARNNIPWPRHDDGSLDLNKEIFREIAKGRPAIATLHELRSSISKMRLHNLSIGPDGRNRTMLSAFGAVTSRNAPSNAESVYGPATWVRSFIKPTPGHGVAYIDWSQQEFGIAAALSGDEAMKAAYLSGDPYLALGKQTGSIPPDGTKETHELAREQLKQAVLGTQYGLEAEGLARKLDVQPIVARRLLEAHRHAYPDFWEWSDGAVSRAMVTGELSTVFGWLIHPTPDSKVRKGRLAKPGAQPNERTLRNFPAQGNGAEMMRIACVLGVEAGIKICMPVNDAVLIEAPISQLGQKVGKDEHGRDVWDDDIGRMREFMAKASREVLDGFELSSDVMVVRHPDRYVDKRGVKMWEKAMEMLARRE